jgi:hypothetical protein
MATTHLSSILARANKARLHVSALSRTAFSDLGGLARSVPDTGGFAVGDGGGTLGGRGLDFGPDIDDTTGARFGFDGNEAAGFGLGQNTSKFELVCFPTGSEEICGGTIGNESTFCVRANCGVSARKKGSTVPYAGMMFVRKNQDSAYVDPGMALDRLDPEIMATWRTGKVSFNIWMDRMETVQRGGEFSTLHEMEEELELGAKSKNFKTPGRTPFKNAEETVDLEWTTYFPRMVHGLNPAELTLTYVASAVEAVEEAVRYSDTRLKHISSRCAAADLDTDTTLQMFDVKLGGLTSAIGGRPLGAIVKAAPTVWGTLSHLADSMLAFHNQINETVTEKVKFFITQADLSPHVAVGRTNSARIGAVHSSLNQSQADITKVFEALMTRLEKAEDLVLALQQQVASQQGSLPPVHPSNFEMVPLQVIKVMEERLAKIELLSDSTSIQFGQLGLNSLEETSDWVRLNYGTHRVGLMCDVYLILDCILGDSDSDQLIMMNKMQYQVKCNLSTGSEAMALLSLSHIVPKIFHHSTAGSFGVGRHMSALSQLKTWEEWADGTNGMKQYILRRLPVV